MTRLIVGFALLFLSSSILAQGIEFFQGSWEETLQEAKAEKKLIFVDAYAVWCGPCKKMVKNVFPKEEVGEYYNSHFVSIKMDMERGEGLTFRKKYPVRAFPTFFYISPEGEIVLSVTGYRQPKDFIEVGRKAIERYDPSAELAKKYEDGDRSPEIVLAYINSLNKRGESSLAAANEYLRSQDNLNTPENLLIIYESTTEADSRIFDYLIQYRSEITQLMSSGEVEAKITSACHQTAKKAFEFEIEELLLEAQTKMRQHVPHQAELFESRTNMEFAMVMKDEKLFQKSSKLYLTGQHKNNPQKLNDVALFVINEFEDSQPLLGYAEKLAKKAATLGQHTKYYLTHAKVLQLQGKNEKAKEIVDRLLDVATKKKESTREILKLKQELENS